MRENSEEYAPWIMENISVDEWCKSHIDPVSAEIDELSLRVVYDLLLDKANMAIEVAYLDRSAGDKVNIPLSLTPSGKPKTPETPTISLLYRP